MTKMIRKKIFVRVRIILLFLITAAVMPEAIAAERSSSDCSGQGSGTKTIPRLQARLTDKSRDQSRVRLRLRYQEVAL